MSISDSGGQSDSCLNHHFNIGVIMCFPMRIRASLYKFWQSCHESHALGTVALLAGLLAAIGTIVHYASEFSPRDPNTTFSGAYGTQLGEHRCEKLPDGSKICINTNSQVTFNFNRKVRHIEIIRGEASFVVVADRRPFDVLSGGVLIHDLSTGFVVFKKHDSTVVTITDGRVQIAPAGTGARLRFDLGEIDSTWKSAPIYRKSQQVEFDESTGKLHELPVLPDWRLDQLLAWEGGRIDLTDMTVSEALTEISRYQPVSKFRVPPSIQKTRLAGYIRFDDLDDLLVMLENIGIHHTKTGTGADTVITLKR